MIRSWLTAIGMFLVAGAAAFADDSVPSAPSLAPGPPAEAIDYGRLDARLQRLMAESDMVGLAVGIVENGEIAFAKGYGETHIGGRQVDENTVFRWASLSKGVAGSAAGLAAAQDRLDLDDSVSSFSTSLRLPKNGASSASIVDVLSHRLGLVSNAYDTRLEDGRDPKDIRNALGRLNLICPVGQCHSYQNVAFDAVSEVLEQATGAPYSQFVKEVLFDPLGMDSASVSRAGLTASANYARPHTRTRRVGSVNDNYYRVPAAGGVNSSILDLAAFMRAQMGLSPDVLPQSVLDQIHAPVVRTLREERSIARRWGRVDKAEYALGWRVYDYAGRRVVGHRGAVYGYRAMILFDPELDTGVVALWNSAARKPVGLQFEVMDMVYGLDAEDWLDIGEVSAAVSSGRAG